MLNTGYHHAGPVAVRYPRGSGTGAVMTPLTPYAIGKAEVKRSGERVAILNFGTLLPAALAASERLNATVVDMRFVKPLDEAMVTSLANTHPLLVTLEENVIAGGAGSAVNELISQRSLKCDMLNLGIADRFVGQGEQSEMLAELGLDANGIEQSIERRLQNVQR